VTVLAILAVILTAATWFTIPWPPSESRRHNDLAATILTTPLAECERCQR
jgi:hypothetical protein